MLGIKQIMGIKDLFPESLGPEEGQASPRLNGKTQPRNLAQSNCMLKEPPELLNQRPSQFMP